MGFKHDTTVPRSSLWGSDHTGDLGDVDDVTITSPATGAVIYWTGSAWIDGDHGNLAGLADNDHTQYRLESADHTHASTGAQAGVLVAADIPIVDSASDITATDVEGALAENRAALDVEEAALVTHAAASDPHAGYLLNAEKYTDAEAISAVEGEATLVLTGAVSGATSVAVAGNITVTGTVDGVDIAARDHAQSHDHSASGDGQVLNPVTVGELDPTTTSALDQGSGSLRWQHSFVEGVNFPATQVASADANTLDDYEEGSWTPVVTFATMGDLSVAYTNQVGKYVKIGSTVTLKFRITTSTFTHTTTSGPLRITGQPFTISSTPNQRTGTVQMSGWTLANVADIAIQANRTNIQIAASRSGAIIFTMQAAQMPTGGTVEIYGQITHTV